MVCGPLTSLKSTLHGIYSIYGSMQMVVILFYKANQVVTSPTKSFHTREDIHTHTPTLPQDH